ncbi:MAG: STAS domain-containing protein [Terriglobales bacterium]
MKLSLKTRRSGAVMIIRCEGRIVYRHEAAALSRVVRQALEHTREVVLDFAGVQGIDSAGLGELVLMHMWAVTQDKALKLAGGTSRVRELLELTNLSSVLTMYSSLEDAMHLGDEWPPVVRRGDAGLGAV